MLVREIAKAITTVNREDRVSVVLVEQNSRLALKISSRGYVWKPGVWRLRAVVGTSSTTTTSASCTLEVRMSVERDGQAQMDGRLERFIR